MLYAVLSAVVFYSQTAEATYYETHFIEPPRAHYDRNALKMEAYRWPNGIVPYQFDASCGQRQCQPAILNAIEVLHRINCVRFVPKSVDQVEHIRFHHSKHGCGSWVGYRPNRSEPLDVRLDDACLGVTGAVQHELLHVLGLFHEHTRPDRDEYVEILWDNIEPNFRQNFVKGSYEYMDTFGLPYDYESLMHYPSFAFARPGSTVTMLSRQNRSSEFGQTKGASFWDLEKVKQMYEC
ncbi:zinc metalloproteinase nas-14-like [Toxorhynchites rutilus septentrionalis]|uniref:zinc metalloproteinase nas-14-like n=1 Tax=Toxorhynchites rutilus septentrionalis TaxID=329112 RepID=UPI00247AC624|nr:zinc metalloproteinase nas-14-like [Toxorhynchites rutilus septentrionalis]